MEDLGPDPIAPSLECFVDDDELSRPPTPRLPSLPPVGVSPTSAAKSAIVPASTPAVSSAPAAPPKKKGRPGPKCKTRVSGWFFFYIFLSSFFFLPSLCLLITLYPLCPFYPFCLSKSFYLEYLVSLAYHLFVYLLFIFRWSRCDTSPCRCAAHPHWRSRH